MRYQITLFAVLIMFMGTASATTYLCVGEAGAAVEHVGESGIVSDLIETESEKYVISDASGQWKFKILGRDESHLVCSSQYYCDYPGGFSAYFMREKTSSVFTYVALDSSDKDKNKSVAYVVKGRCSEL